MEANLTKVVEEIQKRVDAYNATAREAINSLTKLMTFTDLTEATSKGDAKDGGGVRWFVSHTADVPKPPKKNGNGRHVTIADQHAGLPPKKNVAVPLSGSYVATTHAYGEKPPTGLSMLKASLAALASAGHDVDVTPFWIWREIKHNNTAWKRESLSATLSKAVKRGLIERVEPGLYRAVSAKKETKVAPAVQPGTAIAAALAVLRKPPFGSKQLSVSRLYAEIRRTNHKIGKHALQQALCKAVSDKVLVRVQPGVYRLA